jgi:hypothetical protein
LSDAIRPPAAKVERAPLDDDRIDVAENPESLAPWLFIVAVAKID